MKRKEKTLITNSEKLEQIRTNVAGIDIGSSENWVSVSPDICKENIRQFGSYTKDLLDIVNWLVECKVTSVVMESTGIYWVPLYEILEERKIEINLCNANYAKNLPGRKKTDKYDCDWLRKLHSYGMLNPSFIPEKSIREIKVLTRHRNKLTHENNRNVLRMQKSLTLMNFYLHHVVSDITGKTGMNIIHAILNGVADPEELVKHRNIRIKKSKEEMIKALQGNLQFEHLFILKQAVESYQHVCNQIEQCDIAISDLFSQLKQTNKPHSDDEEKANQKIDFSNDLINIINVDLLKVPGFNILSIQNLISETGTDMSKWEDSKHFTSWLGLAPNNKITGGKIYNTSTKKINNRASQTFRNCANTLRCTKSFLGDFFRRKIARIGYKQALTATARKLSVIYYTMMKNKIDYIDLGENYYYEMNKEKVIKKMIKQAEKFGMKLVQN